MRWIALILAAFGMHASFSPLVDAARDGDAASIHRLIAAGADPNAPAGENDWTPLIHAVHKNQAASVAALLDSGAEPNRAVDGGTPLMWAAGYGNTPIVEMLMRRGANPRLTDLDGETALDWALVGTTDIDRFTFFRCQDDTVLALLHSPGAPHLVRPINRRWAAIKRCESVAAVGAR